MISWLKRLFRRSNPVPETSGERLFGTPVRFRVKTYAADTGYVYQYVYRGYRLASDGGSKQYVFEVRRQSGPVLIAIEIAQAARAECQQRIGRVLLDQESYALAKLALFEAFDDEAVTLPDLVTPAAADMVRFLEKLGRA